MSRIVFNDVYFTFDSNPLLTNLSFSCSSGERVCLVGPNGVGKSTVLSLAREELFPISGKVMRSGTVSLLPLKLTPTSGVTLGDLLAIAAAPFRQAEAEFAEVSAMLEDPQQAATLQVHERFEKALTIMDTLDAWTWEVRAREYLTRLGVTKESKSNSTSIDTEADLLHSFTWPLNQLSGGQLSRAHLALTLLSRPEILVLDEPTNHLDSEGVSFLIETINSWPGAVLYASHDRAFIEKTATALLDLDTVPWQALADAGELAGIPAGTVLGAYKCLGAYRHYRQAKDSARIRHMELHTLQQNKKHQLLAHQKRSRVVGHGDGRMKSEVRASKKFYADRAQKVSTRRITDDQRRLDALQQIEVQRPRYEEISPKLPSANLLPGIAVEAREVQVPGRLSPISFELFGGEKLLLIGSNGCGKSTLLAAIAGLIPVSSTDKPKDEFQGTEEVKLDAAQVEYLGYLGVNGKVTYVSQSLPAAQSLPGDFWEKGVGEIGKGFIHPKLWNRPLGQLSEGNLRRAQLAICLAQAQTQILVIDEPTNYLDLDFIESFEDVLRNWPGTVICASHDQWLKDFWPGSVLTMNAQSTGQGFIS